MEVSAVQFRKAISNDMPALKRISQSVIRHNYTPFLGEDATASFIESGMAANEIDEGIESCIVLEQSGEVIAFSIVKGNLLHLIMVDVPFQKAGYGGALLGYTEDALFQKYGRICLQTFKENIQAARFYMKHKWRVTGRADVPELGVTMLQLEKQREP